MSRPRMPSIHLPPHVHLVRSRGREYTSWHPFRGTKRAGVRVALPGLPMLPNGEPNPQWWARYRQLSGAPEPAAKPGSIDALIAAFQAAPEWSALSDASRSYYRLRGRNLSAAWGPLPVRGLDAAHILALRDAMRARPAAANQTIAVLSAMLAWSIPRRWRADNPCEHVPMLPRGEPHAAWPPEAVAEFARLAVPEMRRAAMLALYTGQRLGDVLRMTWHDFDSGRIAVRQQKTGKRVWIRVHQALAAELSTAPRHAIAILTGGDSGQPWTTDGFKSQWQHQMDCLALVTGSFDGLVFHGLRKSAVVALLEAGCTTAQVAAITGQSLQMVEHYASDINQRSMADAAILKWEQGE